MLIRPQNIYSLNNPGNPIILKILVQTTLRLTHKKHIRFLKFTHKQGYQVLGFMSILSEKSRFGDRSYSGKS